MGHSCMSGGGISGLSVRNRRTTWPFASTRTVSLRTGWEGGDDIVPLYGPASPGLRATTCMWEPCLWNGCDSVSMLLITSSITESYGRMKAFVVFPYVSGRVALEPVVRAV